MARLRSATDAQATQQEIASGHDGSSDNSSASSIGTGWLEGVDTTLGTAYAWQSGTGTDEREGEHAPAVTISQSEWERVAAAVVQQAHCARDWTGAGKADRRASRTMQEDPNNHSASGANQGAPKRRQGRPPKQGLPASVPRTQRAQKLSADEIERMRRRALYFRWLKTQQRNAHRTDDDIARDVSAHYYPDISKSSVQRLSDSRYMANNAGVSHLIIDAVLRELGGSHAALEQVMRNPDVLDLPNQTALLLRDEMMQEIADIYDVLPPMGQQYLLDSARRERDRFSALGPIESVRDAYESTRRKYEQRDAATGSALEGTGCLPPTRD